MADCVLVEGMPVCEDVLMNENDIVVISSASEDSNNTLDGIKSQFFVLNRSESLCSDLKLNGELGSCCLGSGMMSSDCEEFTAAIKSINEGHGHNCRKKRCADRYDSSESSDSGVATLSCTDCSGSSSGNSDITEPGSPFSTSSHSESDPESSPAKMPPTQSSAWHWADMSFLDTKRLHDNNNDDADECVRQKYYKAVPQQGKITEYFKAQLKTQQKCSKNLHNDSSNNLLNNMAVRLSSTIVPVSAKLSLVFQQQNCYKNNTENGINNKHMKSLVSSPQHKKSFNSSRELCPTQNTLFGKTNSGLKCSSFLCVNESSVKSVIVPQPNALPIDCDLKATCSTPNQSQAHATAPPLLVSTNEHCLDNPSLPSPILRTPSIIRFPAQNGWKGDFLSDIHCRWSGCKESFGTTSALLEHLQMNHVNSQSLGETFVCLWMGCKVYDKASCSRTWLERHVLSHGGNKPFRCIVDECGQRFSSQTMLERHVNQHFSQVESSSSSSGPSNKRSCDSTPNKLFRRNGKKIRYRREPFSARTFDYIDSGIMEGLQHSLMEATKRQSLGQIEHTNKKSFTLHSKVIGRRRASDGTTTVLLRWFPSDIVKDEWVPQSQVTKTREVVWNQWEKVDWTDTPLFRCRLHHNQRKKSTSR